jgi:hypothetical protein
MKNNDEYYILKKISGCKSSSTYKVSKQKYTENQILNIIINESESIDYFNNKDIYVKLNEKQCIENEAIFINNNVSTNVEIGIIKNNNFTIFDCTYIYKNDKQIYQTQLEEWIKQTETTSPLKTKKEELISIETDVQQPNLKIESVNEKTTYAEQEEIKTQSQSDKSDKNDNNEIQNIILENEELKNIYDTIKKLEFGDPKVLFPLIQIMKKQQIIINNNNNNQNKFQCDYSKQQYNLKYCKIDDNYKSNKKMMRYLYYYKRDKNNKFYYTNTETFTKFDINVNPAKMKQHYEYYENIYHKSPEYENFKNYKKLYLAYNNEDKFNEMIKIMIKQIDNIQIFYSFVKEMKEMEKNKKKGGSRVKQKRLTKQKRKTKRSNTRRRFIKKRTV